MHLHDITKAYYIHLTISPSSYIAAQCNGACGKGSSIECVHINRCSPQKSWRWRLRSTLNLDSEEYRCFNHIDSTVLVPNFRLVTLPQSRAGQPLMTMMLPQSRAGQPLVTIMRAIYSARLVIFIYGSM